MKPDFAGEVDQINITDPVQKELQPLLSRMEWLEKYLDQMEAEKLKNLEGDSPNEAV